MPVPAGAGEGPGVTAEARMSFLRILRLTGESSTALWAFKATENFL